MDESGDLGFDFEKSNTSRYFVMSFVIAENDDRCRKIIAKTVKQMPLRERSKFSGVFHCNKENENVRQNILNALGGDENISIISATLDKVKYKSVCGENLLSVGEMYNNICRMLINRVFEKNLLPQDEKNIFIASRRETNKYINNLFVESFKGYNLEVIVAHPNTYKGLQIADFVAWSFFRQYEYESAKYTNLFRNLVVEDFIIKKA